VANERIGDSERRAVDIVDDAGDDEHDERGALDRFEARGRDKRLGFLHFLRLVSFFYGFCSAAS